MIAPLLVRSCLLPLLVLSFPFREAGVAPPVLAPRALELLKEGSGLVIRDDPSSLERAASLLESAARLEPRLFQARADLALVQLLQAAAWRDDGAWMGQPQVVQRGCELRERALDLLRPLVREHVDDPRVLRAMAVYGGLERQPAVVAGLAARARAAGSADVWIDLAEVVAGASEPLSPASASRLSELAAAHPELLRARMMLAVGELHLGRADDAVRVLDGLLAANPEHDRARQLKAAILAPPAPLPMAVVVPAEAPPRRAGGLLPRKPRAASRPKGARPVGASSQPR